MSEWIISLSGEGLRGNGVVLYGTTCGAEALSFGIEAADMDNAVAVVAPRGKIYDILSAMLGGAEYSALLVSTAWAEKAHLAPCAGHAGFPMFKVMPPSLSASTRARSRVRVPVMPDWVPAGDRPFRGLPVAGSVGYSG